MGKSFSLAEWSMKASRKHAEAMVKAVVDMHTSGKLITLAKRVKQKKTPPITLEKIHHHPFIHPPAVLTEDQQHHLRHIPLQVRLESLPSEAEGVGMPLRTLVGIVGK